MKITGVYILLRTVPGQRIFIGPLLAAISALTVLKPHPVIALVSAVLDSQNGQRIPSYATYSCGVSMLFSLVPMLGLATVIILTVAVSSGFVEFVGVLGNRVVHWSSSVWAWDNYINSHGIVNPVGCDFL